MNALNAIAATLANATQAPAAPAKAAKQATKAAPAKTPTKAAPKAAAPKLAIPYGVHNGSRPGAGRKLFEYSHAWLSLSGMAEGKAFPVAQARQVAGTTAIAYHVGNENFALKDGMLKLTPKGQRFFAARAEGNSHEGVKAFVQVLKTGKPSEASGIKNADMIFRVKE